MGLRHRGNRAVLACIVAGVVYMTPGGTVTANGAGNLLPSPVVNIRLTAVEGLSDISKQALMAEAQSIWRRANVQLRWLGGGADDASGGALRVLVTPRAVSTPGHGSRWAVGELLRFEDSGAIAIASIAGAERIVIESQRYRVVDSPDGHEHRVGVVLGRAVAHEVGHYLLATNTHADEGLMRACIDAREFADLDARSFHLDDAAGAHIASMAAASLQATGQKSIVAFSYASR